MGGPADPAADAIFLLRDGRLDELANQPYASEDLFQRLLAEHPNIIAGSQIDPDAPRRWLLVTREMPVPGEEGGGGRWSLDHLFLDQDGVPTLVEVKRATDIRLRREVVGQMLDYAANAVVHWPVDKVRSRFEARCETAGEDPATEIAGLLQGDDGSEAFWSRVKTNLQAGKIRLIFVADQIPPELRRIIEFLNAQMDPAEVLGLELKQYGNGELRTLVPRVIGQTAATQLRKSASAGPGQGWNEASFFARLEERNGPAVAQVGRRLYEWAVPQGRIWFGSGKRNGSFGLAVSSGRNQRYLFAAWTGGVVEIYFQWLKSGPPFDDESRRLELRERLNTIEGIDIPANKISQRPSVPLSALIPPERLRAFLATLAWARDEIRAAQVQE